MVLVPFEVHHMSLGMTSSLILDDSDANSEADLDADSDTDSDADSDDDASDDDESHC